MTTSVWLRISAVVELLFATGHTLGGLKYWSPMGDNPVLRSMRSVQFDTMGVRRSYFDFFMGFGHCISISQFMAAILLWQLATLARANAPNIRPMIAVIGVAAILQGVVAWRFLFPTPAVFSLLLVASLVVAYGCARRP